MSSKQKDEQKDENQNQNELSTVEEEDIDAMLMEMNNL